MARSRARSRYPEHVREQIPDRQVYRDYQQRRIGRFTDQQVFEYAHAEHINVALMGPTGPGKTTAARAYAAYWQLPLWVVESHGAADPTTLVGRMVQNSDGTFGWVDGIIPLAVRWGGVLLVDEISFLPPKIAALLHPLLDARRQITIQAHRNEVIKADQPWDDDSGEFRDLLIIATWNPGYTGTYRMNPALANRFGIQITWDYDHSVEEQLVWSPALRRLAGEIRARMGEDFHTPLSTNRLMDFERLVVDLGLGFAIQNLVAAFDETERESLRELFNVNRAGLEADYRTLKKADDPDEPSVVWDDEDGDE